MTTTMTVRPIRDDLTFGARVGGVTQDGLGDAASARGDQRGVREVRTVDLRGRRADPEDAGGTQQGHRSAQGPPEQGGAARRRRRPARRHRDAPRAELAGCRAGRWSGAVVVAAVALRPLLQRRAQSRRRVARGRGAARRRLDGLRRRHRAVRRDLARGARPDRGRDRDLRDGRDHGEPPVRPARRFRRRRAGRERRRRDGGV